MNNMCRLCLSVSPQNIPELSENAACFAKILSSLRIEISLNDESLPKKVCQCCIDKVNEIHNFYLKVKESQDFLSNYKNHNEEKNQIDCRSDNKPQVVSSVRDKENYAKSALHNVKIVKIEYNVCCDDDVINEHDEYSHNNTIKEDSIERTRAIIDTTIKDEACIESTNVTINSDNSLILTIFKCLTCFEVFNSQTLLLQHYNNIHTSKPTLGNIDDNYKTIISSDNSTMYKCNVCYKEYGSKKSIERHLMLVHTNERPFVCKLCGRTYKTASEIIRHSRAHGGARYFCKEQCGYSTVYLGALREHEKRHSDANTKFKCEQCGKCFPVRTWYDQHQNVHKGLKPFVCDICGVAFHMNRYLAAHRSSVHPQTSELKRYVCVCCSLPCDSQKALTQHLKEHGFNTNFLCDLCGKTLSNREQLKIHKRAHLGVKPFSCSTCDKSFTKKFNLKLHERTHTGLKQHVCLPCGKHYSQRSALLRHHKRHHGDTEKLKLVK